METTPGWYELGLDLGPRNDERLRRAVAALWSHPDLSVEGPASFDERRRGAAVLPSGAPIVCTSSVTRFHDDDDWLFFGLSMVGLARAMPVGGFPFDDGSDLSWRPSLDAWLFTIARHISTAAEIRLGLIGWDVGDEITADEVESAGVPAERWVGYIVPDAGSLAWYPPNRGAPLTVTGR